MRMFLPFSSPRLGPESWEKKLSPRCKRGMTKTRSWSNWWPSTATSLQRISASETCCQNIRECSPRKQHWMMHTPAIYIYIYIHIFFLGKKHVCIYIYILWNQHPGTKHRKTWMEDATCRSSTHPLQKAKGIHHGPKIGTTHLEAGLLILILWPHFWVQNLAPVLGPQNTNRS